MKIKLFLVSYLIFISFKAISQFNINQYSDIILNWPASIDTQYQFFDEIKSTQGESTLLSKLFPYQTTQFINSYNNINTLDSIIPIEDMSYKGYISWENDSNYYTANKLNFKIEDDTSTVFFLKNKAIQDSSTAFIVIPGSGINQATYVGIYNPYNYHNSTCAIAKFCKNYGDVFTYVRPNEDFATIWTSTGANTRRKMNYTALTSKTNLSNTNWAANCYIQINALTKYLKTKYKKVIVLGLSSGSWGAMFSALQSEPDGAQIASGYSINFTDLTYQYGIDQFHFDGLFSSHPIDSVKKKLKKQSTQYLFSYGSNDAVTHMATENSQHLTQNFFNTPDFASNASFFYNFTTHRFPCEALDTFFTRVIKMPKANLKMTNPCQSDSAILQIKFIGKPPYQFNLVRNDTVIGTYTSLLDSISLTLFQQGEYTIKNILDSNQVLGFNSKPVSFILHPKLTINTISQTYLCGTDSAELTINLTGTPPFNIIKNKLSLNSLDTIITSNNNSTYFLPNDNYQFTTISDSNQCIINSNQIINIDYEKLNLIIQTPVYNCDSNKTQINFALQGNAPWTIHYTENGIPKQINTSSSNLTKLFNNGSYQFINVIDATGCSQSINQVFNFNYQAISVVTTPAFYNCDSNKTQLNFSLQGNAPFNIQYAQDLISQQAASSSFAPQLFLNNGNYNFQTVTDATGCSAAINQNYNFNYDTIDIAISNPVFNCDSNKTQINFALQGNSPWTIHYTENGIPKQINTSSSNLTKFFNNGSYQFINVIDAIGCSQSINQVFNFNYQAILAFATPAFYNCDSNKTQLNFSLQGNSPFTIQYSKDLIAQQVTTSSFAPQLFLNNGVYNFQTVTDVTGCSAAINQNYNFNYDTIDIAISNPVYNCDSNKTQINFALQGNSPWTIHYTESGIPKQINTSSSNITKLFNNGSYQFINVIDATGCSQSINQVFNFNYQAITAVTMPAFYNCDSNKTQLNFSLQGNSPFTIQYSKDVIAQQVATSSFAPQLFLNNGIYNFQTVTDVTGCSAAINQNYNFNYDTIDIAISNPVYNCDSNKTQINFALQGNAPWTINYTESGIPKQINTSSSNLTKFFNNGSYQFINVIDATGCSQSINQVFNFNYQAISVVTTPAFYNCDSNKTQINFSLQGNEPFTIQYSKDLIVQQVATSSFAPQLFLKNGIYNFQTVTDATGCSAAINQNYNLNYDTIDIAISNPVYNCDSNKTQINFALQGNAPWTINYTESGIPKQINTSSSNLTKFFNNGSYQFINVIDATGCSQSINQVFNFNYQAISAITTPAFYNCDSNKTQLNFSLQGNSPFTIQYSKDLIVLQVATSSFAPQLFLNNGVYNFQNVTDATGCSSAINQNYNFNYDTIDIAISNPVYNCDSNKTQINFALQGNAPWTINYTESGIPKQINTNSSNITKFFNNGSYQFINAIDGTGCSKNIYQVFNFNFQVLNAIITQQIFDCDSNKYRIDFQFTGNAPWTIYYQNSLGSIFSKTTNNNTTSIYLANDAWVINSVIDNTNCSHNFNLPLNINFIPLSASIQSQTYDCDSNKLKIQFVLQGNAPWQIQYTNINASTNHIFTTYDMNASLLLANGSYYFVQVTDNATCELFLNTLVNNQYQTLSIQKTGLNYNCDSNKVKIDYSLNGNGPWIMQMKNLNTNTNFQINVPSQNYSLFLSTGNYVLTSVSDQVCTNFLNDTIHVNFPNLNAYITPFNIDCDSGKYTTQFNINAGLKPYRLNYTYNNLPQQVISNSISSTIQLPNGNYNFISIEDSVGCKLMLNTVYVATYTPIEYNNYTTQYNCLIDSTAISIDASGTAPLNLAYQINGQLIDTMLINSGVTKYFSNNTYKLLYAYDNKGCVEFINQTIPIDNNPIQFKIDSINVLCDEKLHQYNFTLEGKSPWNVSYNYENILNNLTLNNPISTWKAPAGKYYFVDIQDANGCSKSILRSDSLPEFLQLAPVITTDYKKIYSLPLLLLHNWYFNSTKIDSFHQNILESRGDGEYFVTITDSAGCEYKSNTIVLDYPENVNLYPNPTKDQTSILINEDFGEYWNYTIFDGLGNKVLNGIVQKSYQNIDVSTLAAGVYNIFIQYEKDFGKNKKVLRLHKY